MPAKGCNVSSLATLTPTQRRAILARLSDEEALALLYDWAFWARPKQRAPRGRWFVWLILAGRGFGKTRTGAEWVRAQVENHGRRRIALVARTAADARDTMVEGESGLLACCPPWSKPKYEPSKRRIRWPNGAIATTYSGDRPDQLRGPQHDAAWADELAAWRYPEAWDQLLFGLRLGPDPRVVVTTTPRPTPLIVALLADPRACVTRGTTLENRANLAPTTLEALLQRYEGTRLGRQELYAEVLTDHPGALWHRDALDAARVARAPDLVRVVVAVDPAVSHGEGSDETGIVVAALGADGDGYILEDASLRASPARWGGRAIEAYRRHAADRIVAETNQGGEMVTLTLRTIDPAVPVRPVRATRGKRTRAEPVAALYEQSRVHHVGAWPELEDQLCQWTPGAPSPDRLDALVWALTELLLSNRPRARATSYQG